MASLRRNFVVWCWILVALAVTAPAQWRRISDRQSQNTDSIEREILAAHNEVRAQANVPPLRWSDRLAVHAQDWASHLLEERQFYHTPRPQFGENLFEITGSRGASPGLVVGDWASEARDYSYRSNTCRGVCGHYTQLVWSGTREVGCAVAREPGHEIWVCNYNPPGNWVGERPY